MRQTLQVLLAICLTHFVAAQELDVQTIRTYDGASNNLEHIDWGAAGSNLLRITDIGYADGISSPGGTSRPNPRAISNGLFAQDGLISDPLNLSDFCWVWGQFLDHDIGITPELRTEPAMIAVPAGDPWFDPFNQGQAVIPMMRNVFDPTTGTSLESPRQHPNEITAFIDGSGVYGSDDERASWLRTFSGGKLKTSAGNLLPFNTVSGQFDDEIDPDAPEMDNPVGITEKVFVAGDVRANENPLLLAFHVLFVREHNRLCEQFAKEHPEWDDEQLYQHARKWVGGIIQTIVYEEWLPAMGVDLPTYQGYQASVNPGLFNIFTGAAFRLGHTLLNGNIQRLDNDGVELAQGNLALRDAFFNPLVVSDVGGIDPYIKGMAAQIQQSLDPKVINDVRNFLFGAPGAGGLDLAAININRGRERGFPDFNTVRQNFDLEPYRFFPQINGDGQVYIRLRGVYNNINDIDPWVGMLSERAMPGALFGETIMTIMKRQFTTLRDGDRFYFENDPVLTDNEKAQIKEMRLHDVIMHNTDIILMQDKVFIAMPHQEICDNMTVKVNGDVKTESGTPVSDVSVILRSSMDTDEILTDLDGDFYFDLIPACDVDKLELEKNDDVRNGVSTFDLILVQKHILGIRPLDSPYKIIAADVDASDNVSTLDLIKIRKVILGIDQEFENNSSWRFVTADFEFSNIALPFEDSFTEDLEFGGILSRDLDQDYIAIKVGDVSGDADVSSAPLDPRNEPLASMELQVEDMLMEKGQVYTVNIKASETAHLMGFQFALNYDVKTLALHEVEPGNLLDLNQNNFGLFAERGVLATSWNKISEFSFDQIDPVLFRLKFKALESGRLSDWLQLFDKHLQAEVYLETDAKLGINLNFSTEPPKEMALELYQNRPNPFKDITNIPFYLPNSGEVHLKVFDVSGKVWISNVMNLEQGKHTWTIDRSILPASGLLYYRIESSMGSATRKMLVLN